mmetsp:Transcript_56498/g.132517  ORF Transcript_56498/g.132517 Transcript_56498/m.132517 type:complete len:331 (+) Transcript_56498:75-1067(+)
MASRVEGDSDQAQLATCFFQASEVMKPDDLHMVREKLRVFAEKQVQASRPIAFVTSGGTTVPLERRTVRFIDNFSSGNRGAATTECLLKSGYSVVFAHRQGSAFPFIRKQMASIGQVVPSAAWWAEGGAAAERETAGLELDELFLPLPFQTIFQYLYLLRECAAALRPVGRQAIFLLAAAVSDFYIPADEMEGNKIQSSKDGLELRLRNVPKFLGLLRSWAPDAYIVSFKLETNENILQAKAAGAIKKYRVDAVVANNLLTYKDIVHIVRASSTRDEVVIESECIQGDETQGVLVRGLDVNSIERSPETTDIEPQLVQTLKQLHEVHIRG